MTHRLDRRDTGAIPPRACVLCQGQMVVKDIQTHARPEYDVLFFKCGTCGLEHPVVTARNAQPHPP